MENTEPIVKPGAGLFKLKDCRIECFFYDAEEDLMTEIHRKIIPFWIPKSAGLLVTSQSVNNIYRKIETDAFTLKRKRTGGMTEPIFEAISIGEGRTEFCLVMGEKIIEKFFLNDNGKHLEKIEVEVAGYTKKEKDLLLKLLEEKDQDVIAGELEKNGITDYRFNQWVGDVEPYIAGSLSWFDDKKIELKYGF